MIPRCRTDEFSLLFLLVAVRLLNLLPSDVFSGDTLSYFIACQPGIQLGSQAVLFYRGCPFSFYWFCMLGDFNNNSFGEVRFTVYSFLCLSA